MKKPKPYLKRPLVFTFLVSCLSGALLGFFHAQYQWAVESAQILAGFVKYPALNPFSVVTTKSWSFLNQSLAFLLKLGISEKILSLLLSVLAGMISFAALSLFTLALSQSLLLAILMPFFVFYLHDIAFPGLNYPIMLLGTDLTYGMLGFSFVLLIISLLSLKKYKKGLFCLGAAPAIHAVQGLWCNLLLLILFLLNRRHLKKPWQKNYSFFVLGGLISILSLIHHLVSFYFVPKVDSTTLSPYYQAIIHYWSDHYQKFSLLNGNTLRIAVSLILSFWLLKKTKKFNSASFISQTFLILFLPAFLLSFIYWLPLNLAHFYFNLLILFPARLFNYHILGSLILLVSLLWKFKEDFLRQLNLFCLIFFLIVSKSLYIFNPVFNQSKVSFSGLMGLIIFLSCIFFILSFRFKRRKSSFLFIPAVLLMAGCIFFCFIRGFFVWKKGQNHFFSQENKIFFQEAAQREGMIIPGPKINYLMLQTRRPLLINGGVGIFNYAPEAAIEAEKILKKVYQIDFLNPPPQIIKHGREIPPEKVKPVWEKRSLSQWQQIKKEFNTQDVITQAGWNLKLPKVAENKNYILYTIPN